MTVSLFPQSEGSSKIVYDDALLNSGARLVELLNSGDRLGEAHRLGQSNWWNGQIGSDTVKADIRVQWGKKVVLLRSAL